MLCHLAEWHRCYDSWRRRDTQRLLQESWHLEQKTATIFALNNSLCQVVEKVLFGQGIYTKLLDYYLKKIEQWQPMEKLHGDISKFFNNNM